MGVGPFGGRVYGAVAPRERWAAPVPALMGVSPPAASRGMAAAVVPILRRRGIEVSPSRLATLIADASADRVVEAALTADSEADFLARLAD